MPSLPLNLQGQLFYAIFRWPLKDRLSVVERPAAMVLLNRTENYEISSRKLWCIQTSWLYSITVFLLVVFFTFYTLRSLDDGERDSFTSIRCSYKPESRNSPVPYNYCPPATNVFFLKTHKCASSTVQNILMRFGDDRNLSFVLPQKSNYIGHPEKFSRTLVSKKITYNMLCHHLRLDINEVRSILPSDAIFITVVRNPVGLFQSMYDYYNMTNYTGVSLESFLNDTKAMTKLSQERIFQRLGRNQMLFDMGYDSNIWENETLIKNAIHELDAFFDLVMVSELFEESVILLRQKLCWGMEDIAYLVHNKRRADSNSSDDVNINLKIREYNKADQMLYDHFYQKLNKAIDEYGRDKMAEDVKDLELWNKLWFDHCVEKLASNIDGVPAQTKAFSSKVYSFVLKNKPLARLCKKLATGELQFTQKLQLKQQKIF